MVRLVRDRDASIGEDGAGVEAREVSFPFVETKFCERCDRDVSVHSVR